MIKIRNMKYEYYDRNSEGYLSEMISAIKGVNFEAEKGEYIAVIGRNGSGKSTFARILNRLTPPEEGMVIVAGLDAYDEKNIASIRDKVALIFQDSDEQIIGDKVINEVIYAIKDKSLSWKQRSKIAINILVEIGLDEYKEQLSTTLSNGEKQLLQIAKALASEAECIIIDEADSMLSPDIRKKALDRIQMGNNLEKKTIVMITHRMDEVLRADKVYVFNYGEIVYKGRVKELYRNEQLIRDYGLEVPVIVQIGNRLYENKLTRERIYTITGIIEELMNRYPYAFKPDVIVENRKPERNTINPVNAILVDGVSVSAGNKIVYKEFSIGIEKGRYVVITGDTGAGKTQLLELISGVLVPDSGTVYVDGVDIFDRGISSREIRKKIGFVCENADQQLFACNVFEDVVFGARQTDISEVEAEKRAYDTIKLMGLSDYVYDISSQKLSGGQKKRAAISGVIAMSPDYLILDEPFVGMDNEGTQNLLNIIDTFNRELGMTIVVSCSDISYIASKADRIIEIGGSSSTEGVKVLFDGSPGEYAYCAAYEESGSNVPVISILLMQLRKRGMRIDADCIDPEEGIARIIDNIRSLM